jgi:site-specific DNA-methyltransferase (adenine-specific)
MAPAHRSPRNKTLALDPQEQLALAQQLLRPPLPASAADLVGRVACGDIVELAPQLPAAFVDLLVLDPPYNLTRAFGLVDFSARPLEDYERWFERWFARLLPALKPAASLYVCSDWRSSTVVHRVLLRHVVVRNRITWEREKGRGAKANWKSASEDIWFATVSGDYYFNVEAVKLRRQVLAPYREAGQPKGWEDSRDGRFRLTHPSNLWTDLTVPFWAMPENTAHPTQKPEKLVAKLLLASSREGDVVFDPFLGSGTTAAVAVKLGRKFFGVELDPYYCCLALKRAQLAREFPEIQGYAGGVFWERNTRAAQVREARARA